MEYKFPTKKIVKLRKRMYEETFLNTFEQKQNGVTRNPNPIGILGVDVNL